MAIIHVSSLMSSTALLFPSATKLLFATESSATYWLTVVGNVIYWEDKLRRLTSSLFDSLAGTEDEIAKRKAEFVDILGSSLLDVAEAFCWYGEGETIWYGILEGHATIAMALTSSVGETSIWSISFYI